MGTAFHIADTYRKNRPAKYGLDYYSPWDRDSDGGKLRKKEYFRTKQEREDRRDELEGKWRQFGESAGEPLTPAQVEDYRAAVALLPDGVTMRAAASVYSQHLVKTGGKPLADVISAYAAVGGELYARGADPRWIRDVHSTLRKFSASMPQETTIKGPRPDDIRAWLSSLKGRNGAGYSSASIHGFRRQLHGLFEWAATQGMRDDNPVAVVASPKTHRGSPVFYDLAQTRAILGAAVLTDPEMVPLLCLRFFAGIRSSEVRRMLPADVLIERKMIDLPGFRAIPGASKQVRVTKSGKRRIIEDAPDCLWDWLTKFPLKLEKPAPVRTKKGRKAKVRKTVPKLAGCVNYMKRLRAILKAAHVPMKRNAMRHNFATFHVALKKSANLTILILGQEENSNVFYKHYRNPNVTAEEAQLYFGLKYPDVLPWSGA
jgi:site-specific recombinase XerD